MGDGTLNLPWAEGALTSGANTPNGVMGLGTDPDCKTGCSITRLITLNINLC